jgi:hypothetical protein
VTTGSNGLIAVVFPQRGPTGAVDNVVAIPHGLLAIGEADAVNAFVTRLFGEINHALAALPH